MTTIKYLLKRVNYLGHYGNMNFPSSIFRRGIQALLLWWEQQDAKQDNSITCSFVRICNSSSSSSRSRSSNQLLLFFSVDVAQIVATAAVIVADATAAVGISATAQYTFTFHRQIVSVFCAAAHDGIWNWKQNMSCMYVGGDFKSFQFPNHFRPHSCLKTMQCSSQKLATLNRNSNCVGNTQWQTDTEKGKQRRMEWGREMEKTLLAFHWDGPIKKKKKQDDKSWVRVMPNIVYISNGIAFVMRNMIGCECGLYLKTAYNDYHIINQSSLAQSTFSLWTRNLRFWRNFPQAKWQYDKHRITPNCECVFVRMNTQQKVV